MLDRRPTSDPSLVEVTFRLPIESGAEDVHVVGDFNSWSREATPLRRDEGGFSVTLELAAGRAYQFRYLIDGHLWENDWAADDYVGNEFGGENSLLDLTNGSVAGSAAASHVGELHEVGTIEEPELAAVEEALAVDTLATESSAISEAASALTPVAEGGLAAPPAPAPTRKKAAPAKDERKKAAKPAKLAKAPKKAPKKAPARSAASKGKGTASSGGKGKEEPTKAELLEAAKELDISGRSKMHKNELAKAVAAARKR